MNTQVIGTSVIGNYCGVVAEAFIEPVILAQLADIPQLLAADNAERLSKGADYVVKVMLEDSTGSQPITIKVFKRQNRLKDWHDRRHKSKAERSFRAAVYLQQQGIGTPAPIAWLDRWENGRLLESYYICLFEPAICFRDALFEVYHHHKDSEQLMELMLLVAPAIRKMHDTGFMHGDLGNQNILLPKNTDGSWAQPSFIDLNRYQYFPQGVTDKARAFDLARPILPGNYLHFFLQIYASHQELPATLAKLHQQQRAIFTRHRNSRKYRHPIRRFKNRNKHTSNDYPHNQDYWLWDEKTAQPMIALSKQEKNNERNPGDMFRSLGRVLIKLPSIIGQYRKLKANAFATPVELKNRIGVALNPKENYLASENNLLATLGNPPVFIRFYRHESPAQWRTTIELIQTLHKRGFSIMVGLLQDREAVIDLAKWKQFLDFIIPGIANQVEQIEITHAYNRAKWGIWRLSEWRNLCALAFDYKQHYPNVKLAGPACIDFEYAPIISAFSELKKINVNYRFDALSHLLYVDRRGAPENKQGGFSTLEKAQLLKAIAQTSSACSDKVIVSEVNWPLENTHVWSPIVCPYVTARWQRRPSGEAEDVYAHYMLRYLAITLCSGYVDQVFWWQLSAKGYGLVDDQHDFQPRPAFTALAFFLTLLGDARFEHKRTADSEDYLLEFSKGKCQYLMAWSTNNKTTPLSCEYEKAWNYLGEPLEPTLLSGAPIYLLLK